MDNVWCFYLVQNLVSFTRFISLLLLAHFLEACLAKSNTSNAGYPSRCAIISQDSIAPLHLLIY